MGQLQTATFDNYKDMLLTQIGEDLAELLTSRRAYAEMQKEAGSRPWAEFLSWAQLARWYVGSQLQVLERNLTSKPREPGLARIIAYVGTHAEEIVELEPAWAGRTGGLRAELNRAAPKDFSRRESERDMEILRGFRQALQTYRVGSGDHWQEIFEQKCREFSGEDSPTFDLPPFDELDLAINTFLDLIVKYAELAYGESYHPFAVGLQFTGRVPVEPLARGWRAAGDASPAAEYR
jgi:hypothetical protein